MSKGNNRKLIGTIIGVIFFAILIIGATFAWLIYTIGVNNGVYNGSTLNFTINYIGGTGVNSLPLLSGDFTYYEYVMSSERVISGYAYKQDLDGVLYLKLHIDDTPSNDAFINAGCIRYATIYSPGGLINNNTIIQSLENTGLIDYVDPESRDAILYEGPLLPDERATPAFKIILWIDSELVTNDLLGLNFTGYIHASAIQSNPSDTSSSGKIK